MPHHPSSIVHLANGEVRVKPKTKYHVIACPVCGKTYKKDVKVAPGHGCPHCVRDPWSHVKAR